MARTAKRKGALAGRVAVVAGATRGAGRGIATALGEAGATVYCTGRSTRRSLASGAKRPETIEETAERVTAAGGHGIPMRVDHLVERDVKALFSRVTKEQGRLDVLVNDVWGGDVLAEWGKPFWNLDVSKTLGMLTNAVHSHIITSRHGAPMMVKARRGLIVEITDGDGMAYRGLQSYDLVKTSVIRLAFGMAEELRPHRVAAVAVTPGFLRSEMMLDLFGVTEKNWRHATKKQPDFAHSETPLFVGRAVAALAADPKIMAKTGRVFGSWTLAKQYGFRDADGRRPDIAAHFRKKYGNIQPRLDDAYYAYLGDYQSLKKALAAA